MKRGWVVLARIVHFTTDEVLLESRHWTSGGALKQARWLNHHLTRGLVSYWVEPIKDARQNYPNLDLK